MKEEIATNRIRLAIVAMLATVAAVMLLSEPNEADWAINLLLIKPAGAFMAWQAVRLSRIWRL